MTVSECAYSEVKTAGPDYSRQKENGDPPMKTIAAQGNCLVERSAGQAPLRTGYRTRSESVSSVWVDRRLSADTSAPRSNRMLLLKKNLNSYGGDARPTGLTLS